MIERFRFRSRALFLMVFGVAGAASAAGLEPIKYNNPGLVVDLGVGLWAWPLPMDYDQDGDLDLVVSCPDVPFNGLYLFEIQGAIRSSPCSSPPCASARRAGTSRPRTSTAKSGS